MGRLVALALAFVCALPPSADSAAKWIEMYRADQLIREQSRFERFTGKLFPILRDIILTNGLGDRGAITATRIRLTLPDADTSLLNFYSSQASSTVFMPVFSLLFLEDLTTAYAWLYKKGYSLETIDEYLAMLHFKAADAFPRGRYPPPLEALGIPANATSDREVDELSLRFRNSAVAFILAHELGHIALHHPGYKSIPRDQARRNEAEADAFALSVLARAANIPMGAVLFFQAQAYTMPSLGLYKAQGRSVEEWDSAMRREITHPLTPDRLSAIAVALNRQAMAEPRPAERASLNFIATRLAVIAEILNDADLQQCVAVAAARADPAELRPRRAGQTEGFLKKCTKSR